MAMDFRREMLPGRGFEVKTGPVPESTTRRFKLDLTTKLSDINRAIFNNDVAAIKQLAPRLHEEELTKATFLAASLRTTEEGTLHALFDFGAPVNGRDGNGRTYLHEAAANGNVDASIVLVKVGVDINAVRKDGTTAILEASKSKQYGTVAVLDEMHADSTIKNRYGENAVKAVELVRLRRDR